MIDSSVLILLGFIGGLLPAVYDMYHHRMATEMPVHVTKLIYWIPTIVMALVGALLVFVYQNTSAQLNAMLALQVGITAPLFIKTTMKSSDLKID